MRAFIAIQLPEEFEAQVADLARQLAASIDGRFMKRDTYHVTLAFLGECNQQEIADAMDAIDEAASAVEAAFPGGIPLKADSLGKFGRATDATLWLGLVPNDAIMQLAQALRESLRSRGVGFDDKPFKPHITLARRASIPKGGLPPLPFPEDAMAGEVTLFKSVLSKEGASYNPLYERELG